MKRPLVPAAILFALGILAARVVSIPTALAGYLLIALFPLLFIWRTGGTFYVPFLGCFLLLGVLNFGLSSSVPRNHISFFPHEGRMSLEGVVSSLPEKRTKNRGNLQLFELTAENIYHQKKLYRVRGRLQVFVHHAETKILYGDRLRLWGDLREVPQARNPGEFDYRSYLGNRKIFRTFQCFGGRSVRVLSRSHGSRFLARVFETRLRIKEATERSLPFPENQILSALLIGLRKEIPDPIRDDFVKTGTAHVLAVSGLNISIVSGLFYFLLRGLRIPQKANAGCTLLFIAGYVLVSGYNAPVLRAGIMGAILLGGLLLERESDSLNSLAVAFFALLFFKPENLFTASFQLSFVTVLMLILWMPKIQGRFRSLRERRWARAGKALETAVGWERLRGVLNFFLDLFVGTLVAVLGSFPLVMYYFHIVSPISLVANLVIVPLTNLSTFAGVILLPIFLFLPSLSNWVSWIPKVGIQKALAFNHFLAGLPGASFYVSRPSLLLLWAYYAAIVALVTWRRKWFRKLAGPFGVLTLVAAIGIGVLSFTLRSSKSVQLHVLDVAQAPVLFVQFPEGSNLLLNAGREKPRDDGKWILKPFLASQAVQQLNAVCLSSYSKSEMGGTFSVLEEFPSDHFFLPARRRNSEAARRLFLMLQKKKIPSQTLVHGDRIEGLGKVQPEILSVEKPFLMKISYAGKTVLIAIDLEGDEGIRKAWDVLEARMELKSEVLIVEQNPILSEEALSRFLAKIEPRVLILIGGGERPNAFEGEFFTTEGDGSIRIEMGEHGLQVSPFLKR